MKISLPLLVAVASVAPTAFADPAAENATISAAARADISRCTLPANYAAPWYYKTWSIGPFQCSLQGSDRPWAMLRAYRAGGVEGVHWKYTTNDNDPDCLNGWDYYDTDGVTFLTHVNGRTTNAWDPRRWCALPVYLPGGVEGKQWAYCKCS